MPVRNRKSKQIIPSGMSNKQMKRRKPLNFDIFSKDIEPLTDAQRTMFESWEKDKHLFAYGCAGTGKTFVALYLALKSVLDETNLSSGN